MISATTEIVPPRGSASTPVPLSLSKIAVYVTSFCAAKDIVTGNRRALLVNMAIRLFQRINYYRLAGNGHNQHHYYSQSLTKSAPKFKVIDGDCINTNITCYI